MTVARSVTDVLSRHVDFEVECIDRMYLNLYQPRLQHVGGVVWFLRGHLGHRFASSALMDPITKSFVADIHAFTDQHRIPWVNFAKGQRKDDVAHEYLAGFEAAGRTQGVLFVGRAQEKQSVFRTEKRHNPVTGASYPWIVRGTAIFNQFYFYCVDAEPDVVGAADVEVLAASATIATTVATGIRSPRKVGTPPIRAGSTVIRVNFTPPGYARWWMRCRLEETWSPIIVMTARAPV